MQRHNFTAVTQEYPERSCNMEATVVQAILFLGERGLAFRGESQRLGTQTMVISRDSWIDKS